MFLAIYKDPVGLVHLLSALVAMLAGGYILFAAKATATHRKVGYLYTASMAVMLATAFAIYNLYDSFSVFHYLALFSSLTLVGGMIPVILRKPNPGYVRMHFGFMYWSVIGLYMAFVAESAVRLPAVVIEGGVPNTTFWVITAVASGVVMIGGNVYYFMNKKRWTEQFGGAATGAGAVEG